MATISMSSLTPTSNTGLLATHRAGSQRNVNERTIPHTRMEDEDVQKEYQYGEIIGEGSFGKVYKATQTGTGDTVAIKEIAKEKAGSSGLKQLEKEVAIFKKVDHKNIIELKEVIESPKKMYLVMELCRGGDLARLLQKRDHLSEEDTKSVMGSLAEALKYLHQQGIWHRDLKLENILLAEEPEENGSINIKVSDFGLSTQQTSNSYENMQEQYCGTPSYMAPEMTSTYSNLVDVWAMGLIMYYLLTSYPKDNILNESMAADGPVFKEPQWEAISQTAKDLLKEILRPDPAHRISTGEVLNHEWFTGKKREYPNVLQMMKEFKQEQEEGRLSDGEDEDRNLNSAINGVSLQDTEEAVIADSSESSNNGKKEARKGSGGKKGSIGEASGLTPPGSGVKGSRLKPPGTVPHTTAQRLTSSKTPTLKNNPQAKVDKVTPSAHRVSSNNGASKAALPSSSHATSQAKSMSKAGTNQKLKKK